MYEKPKAKPSKPKLFAFMAISDCPEHLLKIYIVLLEIKDRNFCVWTYNEFNVCTEWMSEREWIRITKKRVDSARYAKDCVIVLVRESI